MLLKLFCTPSRTGTSPHGGIIHPEIHTHQDTLDLKAFKLHLLKTIMNREVEIRYQCSTVCVRAHDSQIRYLMNPVASCPNHSHSKVTDDHLSTYDVAAEEDKVVCSKVFAGIVIELLEFSDLLPVRPEVVAGKAAASQQAGREKGSALKKKDGRVMILGQEQWI